MAKSLKIIFLLINIVLHLTLFAQNKDSLTGSIAGSVKDTSLNYFLRSATVAIYKEDGDKLISYTLTNSLGEFTVKGLPLNLPMVIRISFVDYQTYSRRIELTPRDTSKSFGMIVLQKNSGLLNNITITPPPVRMHNDTLEFSAAAFDLGKNAVAEDLLKKLPGVIVWGDGTITVNGRQINKLLVDSKPFLNGDTKVATQNIPKDAIQKVQVYQEFVDPNNPIDSVTDINIRLRKGKHNGFFGLLSGGMGTDKRYESVLNANIFSPRNQFSLIGQTNNINKPGNNLNTILRNNTYKGKGAKVEYQPDFDIPGLNKQNSGGFLFTHDFIPNFNQYEKKRIAVNSFINDLSSFTQKKTDILNFLGNDTSLRQKQNSVLHFNTSEFTLSSRYDKLKNENSHFFEAKYDFQTTENVDSFDQKAFANGDQLFSSGSQYESSTTNLNKVSFGTGYEHHGFFNDSKPKLTNWLFSYSYNSVFNDTSRLVRTTIEDSLSHLYNRKYDNHLKNTNHSFSFKLGDFAKWLFNNNRTLSRLNIQFENEALLNLQSQNNWITDKDPNSIQYLKNDYLSTVNNYSEFNTVNGLSIGRNFTKLLANRYQKDLDIIFSAKFRYIKDDYSNNSVAQKIERSYQTFVPSAKISYSNFQYGEFVDRYDLNFNTTLTSPTRDQLFHLADSSDLYFIYSGNPNLVPVKNSEISFRYQHNSVSRKNSFYYGSILSAGISQNYLGDSIITRQNGQKIYYNINLKGHGYWNLKAFFNKELVIDNNEFQFNLESEASRFRNPGYFEYENSSFLAPTVSKIFMQSDSLSFNYTYKDLFSVSFLQYYSLYKSEQVSFPETKFNNLTMLTRLGISANATGKLSLNSTLSFKKNSSPNFPTIRSAILNASVSYRFLKADNLEFKLSGLDLLDQNKGVINFGNNYSYTQGTINLLHQYFVVNVSYFPRKFGRKAAKIPNL